MTGRGGGNVGGLWVKVRVVDELFVQLLCLLRVELLAGIWALERSGHLDADLLNGSAPALRRIRDFHEFLASE